jgi:hypothetical protein
MKVVAVIPIHGRFPLLKYTIRRLYEKNGVYQVICIGETKEEEDLCESEGAVFVKYKNNPLGEKWNAGFKAARDMKPDACLFVGSSDWISDNWLSYIEPLLKDYDMIGKPDFNLLDIGNTYRFCHWQGYTHPSRMNEPIGIGRVLSARILYKLQWNPINPGLNSSIDWSMYQNVIAVHGKVKLLRTEEIQSLSISTNQWPNKHKFEDHYSGRMPSFKRPDFKLWLDNMFPEYKEIFK